MLARFDAADAHDADGYGTSAAWLIAMTDMTRPDAKTKVWRMRLLRGHPAMAAALADADASKSQALAIAKWTKKLPAELRIHRLGWRLVLHPDGTTTAYGPDGQVLHSHSPPTTRAA